MQGRRLGVCQWRLVPDETVTLHASQHIDLTVPARKNPELKGYIEYKSPLVAPINKGDVLGVLVVRENDKEILRSPVVAGQHIEKTGFFGRLSFNIRNIFLMFISFEGIDGCGKSTQIKRVADNIVQNWRKETVLTREPGGTEKAEKIRDFVLHTDIASPFAEALMMNAARYLHFDEVIKPALARGAWVLSDRFIHSTFAYQAEVGFDKLKQLHNLTTDSLYPDLTFILDISAEAARLRRNQQDGADANDVYEKRDNDFKQKLRETYLELASNDEACHVIDASQPVADITQQIIAIIQQYINEGKKS